MNEVTLTYIANNLTIITVCGIFAVAVGYQIAAELKKVLTNKK